MYRITLVKVRKKNNIQYLWGQGHNAPEPIVVIVAPAAIAADVGVSVGGQWATGDRRWVMVWWWVVLVSIGVEVGWLVWSLGGSVGL